MTEKIKPPAPEIVKAIVQILDEKDIFIPTENIEMVTAVFSHWLSTSQRGSEYMAYLLKLDAVGGRHEQSYTLRDNFGRLTEELDPESIYFLRGCLVKNESVPVSQIEIKERERKTCEGCGSSTVCTVDVDTTDTQATLCSYCISSNESQEVRDSCRIECEACTYIHCNWHQTNLDVPPYNPPLEA